MAFGKRAPLHSGRDSTPGRPLTGAPTEFLNRLALIVGAVAAMSLLGYFSLKLQSQWLDDAWENRGRLPIDAMLNDFDGVIGGAASQLELAVHGQCRTIAIRDLMSLTQKQRDKALKAWASGMGARRLKRVADYVACSLTNTQSRFCKDGSRQRAAALVLGYFEVQKYEARIDKEDREYNPWNYIGKSNDETFDGLPVSILSVPDQRIMEQVRYLLAAGYLAPGDFSPGFFSTLPGPLKAALEDSARRFS